MIIGGEENMCHGENLCYGLHHGRRHGTHHGRYHGRRFLTTEEKIERLQEYKEWLDNESKGVEEAILKLKKTS